MHQRIADLIYNGTIELCLFTLYCKVDFFIEFLCYVANHSWETVEHGAYRNHTYLHDYGLQISRHAIHLLKRLCQFRKAMRLTYLFQANLIDYQFTDEVHKRIQLLYIYTHRLAGMRLLGLCCCLLLWSCFLRWCSSRFLCLLRCLSLRWLCSGWCWLCGSWCCWLCSGFIRIYYIYFDLFYL